MELLKNLPPWVGLLGWLAVLVGFLMQRRANRPSVTQSNQSRIFGSRNQVSQVNQHIDGGGAAVPPPAAPPPADSLLSRGSNWATIAGLLVSLVSLAKDFLPK